MSTGENALMKFNAWGYEFRKLECKKEPRFRDWIKREQLRIEGKNIYKRWTKLNRSQTSKAAEGVNSGPWRTLHSLRVIGMVNAQLVNTVSSAVLTGCRLAFGFSMDPGNQGSLFLLTSVVTESPRRGLWALWKYLHACGCYMVDQQSWSVQSRRMTKREPPCTQT